MGLGGGRGGGGGRTADRGGRRRRTRRPPPLPSQTPRETGNSGVRPPARGRRPADGGGSERGEACGGGEARFERDAAEQPPPDLSPRPTDGPTDRGAGPARDRLARDSGTARGGRAAEAVPGRAARVARGRAGCPREPVCTAERGTEAAPAGRSGVGTLASSSVSRGWGVGVRPKMGLGACRSLPARSWETFSFSSP